MKWSKGFLATELIFNNQQTQQLLSFEYDYIKRDILFEKDEIIASKKQTWLDEWKKIAESYLKEKAGSELRIITDYNSLRKETPRVSLSPEKYEVPYSLMMLELALFKPYCNLYTKEQAKELGKTTSGKGRLKFSSEEKSEAILQQYANDIGISVDSITRYRSSYKKTCGKIAQVNKKFGLGLIAGIGVGVVLFFLFSMFEVKGISPSANMVSAFIFSAMAGFLTLFAIAPRFFFRKRYSSLQRQNSEFALSQCAKLEVVITEMLENPGAESTRDKVEELINKQEESLKESCERLIMLLKNSKKNRKSIKKLRKSLIYIITSFSRNNTILNKKKINISEEPKEHWWKIPTKTN